MLQRSPSSVAAFIALAAVAHVGAPAFGQSAGPTRVVPVAPTEVDVNEVQEVEGMVVPGPTSDTDLKPAYAALNRMIAAYRGAPTLVEDIRIHQFAMGRPYASGVQEARVVFGEEGRIEITGPRSRTIAKDGTMIYENERYTERYVETPIETDLLATMVEALSIRPTIGWQVAARVGRDAATLIGALSFPLGSGVVVAGHEAVELKDGMKVDRVTLRGPTGWSIVTIETDTGFIRGVDIEYTPEGSPFETFRIAMHVRCKRSELVDTVSPFTFDPGRRRKVGTMAALIGRALMNEPVRLSVKTGEAMPDFTSVTIEGEPYRLSERRGRVQALLFWNLQSVPFRQGEPAIKDLQARLNEAAGGVPVDLMLVSTLDTTDIEEKWDEVYDFWYDRKFKTPCLFDPEDEIAGILRLTSVPVLVLVDAKGRYMGSQGGFGADWPEIASTMISRAQRGEVTESGMIRPGGGAGAAKPGGPRPVTGGGGSGSGASGS